MGMGPDEGRLRRAVEASDADKMRQLEKRHEAHWKQEGVRTESKFVRKAEAGGWRDVLAPELAEAVAEAFAPVIAQVERELGEDRCGAATSS